MNLMTASSVAPAIGRNDLIFKRANSQEELVLEDSSSSGENRCCGDEAGGQTLSHYRGPGDRERD